MRSNKELLELMLKNQHHFTKVSGLCHWVNLVCAHKVITEDEADSLMSLIHWNRPRKKWSSISAYSNAGFYWEPGKIKPRIKWIKKQIKLNS